MTTVIHRRNGMPMEIEEQDGITIVTLTQSTLEADNVPVLWEEFETVLKDTSRLVVDLSKVNFIDSTGCGIFPNAIKNLSEKEGELKVCGLSDKLSALFRLMAFDRLMDILETKEAAIAAFDG